MNIGASTWSGPLTVTSPGFAAMMLALVAASWLGLRGAAFSAALAAAGLIVAASWLDTASAFLFALAIVPGGLISAFLWARPDRASTWFVGLAVAFQVAVLAAAKLGPMSEALGFAGTVGLSYLTFRQIHLFVEAGRQPQGSRFSLADWLGYLVNPWVLLAGPIQTWRDYEKGLAEKSRPDASEVLAALNRITKGAVKVLILAPLFRDQGDAAILSQISPGWRDFVVTFYGYYVFLFLDFSGYIDMVLGAARLAGYRSLPENFDRPYLATNVQDFWRRWHITLGVWFRAYVFTPLLAVAMRRWGAEHQDAAVAFALMAIFVLIGLWHGLAWSFVVFGVIHALGVVGVFLSRQWAIGRFGTKAVRAYEADPRWKPLRILLCQHFIAATFMLLDNDLWSVMKLLGKLI